MNMRERLTKKLGRAISEASDLDIYYALLSIIQELSKEKENPGSKKKLYYISAEFLVGKLLSNNLIN